LQGLLTRRVSDVDEAVTIALFHRHAGGGDSRTGHAFWIELVGALSCRALLTESPIDVDQVLAAYSEDEFMRHGLAARRCTLHLRPPVDLGLQSANLRRFSLGAAGLLALA
jgi:hypothetical protein